MMRRVWILVAALALLPGAARADDIRSPDPWQTPKAGSSMHPLALPDAPSSAPSMPEMSPTGGSYDSPTNRSFEPGPSGSGPPLEKVPDEAPKK